MEQIERDRIQEQDHNRHIREKIVELKVNRFN